MAEETLKKRGAPEGNQYARTHGFYSKVLDEMEQLEYTRATEVLSTCLLKVSGENSPFSASAINMGRDAVNSFKLCKGSIH